MSLLPGRHHTGVITFLRRRRNSVNGNPSWAVTFDGQGSVNTKTDAQVGLMLSPAWEGDRVTVTIDGRGQIIDAERTPA